MCVSDDFDSRMVHPRDVAADAQLRTEADAQDEFTDFLARLSEARRRSRETACEVARVLCSTSGEAAADLLEAFSKAHELSVSELVMFRSLVLEEARKLVASAATDSSVNLDGLDKQALMTFRGYRFYLLDGDNDAYWAYHGEIGVDVIHSPHAFTSKAAAADDAELDFKQRVPIPAAEPKRRRGPR